jgi:hypothetical protein
MIDHQTMSTIPIQRASARGIIQGYEIRALRGGDGTKPSANQDLLDTGIAPSHGFLPSGVVFVPGTLIVR